VTQARLTDSGNYTCVPSNANPASIMVHVLNGKRISFFYDADLSGGPSSLASRDIPDTSRIFRYSELP